MKSIELDNLVIEVTRRCNLTCAHCLRGAQQRINIKKEHIEKLLSNVCYVNDITFTGREPTLYLKGIEDTLDIIEKKGITVNSFYIVTNGCFSRKTRIKLMGLIVRMHEIGCETEGSNVRIELSNEMYHYEEIVSRDLGNLLYDNVRFLSILKCFGNKYHKTSVSMELNNTTYYRTHSLINEGRTVKLNTKCEKVSAKEVMDDPYEVEVNGSYIRVLEETYLAANGNVVFGCNYSFKRIDGMATYTSKNFAEKINQYDYEKSSH